MTRGATERRIRRMMDLEISLLSYLVERKGERDVRAIPEEERQHLRVVLEAAIEIEAQYTFLRRELDAGATTGP